MKKNLYFFTVLLVLVLGMAGCSGSTQKSAINEQSSKETLKTEEEQTSNVTQSTQLTETEGTSEINEIVLDEESYDIGKVLDLFISRFLIKSPDKGNTLYALKRSPSEFLYSVNVDGFDEERDMYQIRLTRNTDTVQNYFYYDPATEKFFFDGNDKEEITSDDGLFFWSPF